MAICPAPEDLLLRGLRSGRLVEFEVDREALEPWLEALDLYEAVGRLGPKTALLLMHAEGDEQIPYTVSQELHAAAKEPEAPARAARAATTARCSTTARCRASRCRFIARAATATREGG